MEQKNRGCSAAVPLCFSAPEPGSGKRTFPDRKKGGIMRLGGTIAGTFSGPEEWEDLLVRSHFRAVTAPFTCRTPREEIAAYCAACKRHDVLIAEIGVWKNIFDPDPEAAKAALDLRKASWLWRMNSAFSAASILRERKAPPAGMPPIRRILQTKRTPELSAAFARSWIMLLRSAPSTRWSPCPG